MRLGLVLRIEETVRLGRGSDGCNQDQDGNKAVTGITIRMQIGYDEKYKLRYQKSSIIKYNK